jgi:hypothetical protein
MRFKSSLLRLKFEEVFRVGFFANEHLRALFGF